MFCPNCGAEFKPGFVECNDCLVPLVDEPPESPEEPKSLVTRLSWTAGLLAVFLAMSYIPQPTLNFGNLENFYGSDTFHQVGRILSLGVFPFITGFILVELFSLLTPWGRRAREDGSVGRRKLNRWAVRCSLIVCLIQSFAVIISLEAISTPDGVPLIANPGIFSRLVSIASIIAGSAAAFVLCNVITARGIGNGFCLVLAIETVRGTSLNYQSLQNENELSQSALWLLILSLVVALVFAALLRQQDAYSLYGADDSPLFSRLPTFPQGIVPIGFAYSLLNLPAMLQGRFSEQELLGPVAYTVGLAVAVPVLSYATLHLFSSRTRVEHNLPNVVPVEDFDALMWRRFLLATAAMTITVVCLNITEAYLYAGYFLLGAAEIALLVAVVLDLFDEWQFHRRHPDAEILAELDNVHLAYLVETHLAERGVACRVKALRFRSLFFFLGPIYKMSVMVASDRLDEAREWFDGLNPRIL